MVEGEVIMDIGNLGKITKSSLGTHWKHEVYF